MLDAHARALREVPAGAALLHNATPLPAASLAIRATVEWIERCYNREHPHTGHGMGRRTPEQVFRAGYALAEQQKNAAALSPRALDEFLRDRQRRQVFNSGCVRMYKAQFEPADAESLAVLRCWDDQEVLVAADPHNVGDAVAYNPETGEFLGALVSKTLLAWGESQDTIRARMRAQRRTRRAAAQYVALLGQRDDAHFGFLGPAFSGTATPGCASDALPAAVPARALPARPPRADLASPFVSDAVRDSDFWKEDA